MKKEFIREFLVKPETSPEPDIFNEEKVDIIYVKDFTPEKIKIEKEVNEIYYNHFYMNSALFFHQLRKSNLSYYHLFFIVKLYHNCSNQKILFETLEKLYEFC